MHVSVVIIVRRCCVAGQDLVPKPTHQVEEERERERGGSGRAAQRSRKTQQHLRGRTCTLQQCAGQQHASADTSAVTAPVRARSRAPVPRLECGPQQLRASCGQHWQVDAATRRAQDAPACRTCPSIATSTRSDTGSPRVSVAGRDTATPSEG